MAMIVIVIVVLVNQFNEYSCIRKVHKCYTSTASLSPPLHCVVCGTRRAHSIFTLNYLCTDICKQKNDDEHAYRLASKLYLDCFRLQQSRFVPDITLLLC